jgi:antiviral helicase SLH1
MFRVCTQVPSTRVGLTREEVADDPHLGAKCHQLTTEAARKLAAARMINFDVHSGAFAITDLGTIAAKYYIRYASIEVFNQKFKPKMSEADALAMLSCSTEVSADLCVCAVVETQNFF